MTDGWLQTYAAQVANNLVFKRFRLDTWIAHNTCCDIYLAITAAIVEAVERGRQEDASRKQSPRNT